MRFLIPSPFSHFLLNFVLSGEGCRDRGQMWRDRKYIGSRHMMWKVHKTNKNEFKNFKKTPGRNSPYALFRSVWGSHAPSYKNCKYKNVAVIKEKRHLQMTDLFTVEKVIWNETLELGREKWNYYSLKRKQTVGLRKCCIGRTEITVYHIEQTKHVNNCEQRWRVVNAELPSHTLHWQELTIATVGSF